jgi:hypothetical protein
VFVTGHPTAERFKDSIKIGRDMFDEAGILSEGWHLNNLK